MKPGRLFLLPLAIALSGCGGAEERATAERKNAAGEVLGGSISDDMLPLDTVTSESPRMREVPASDDSTAPTDGAQLPPRDSDEGPGEPPRDPAPAAAADPAPAEPVTEE